MARPTIYNNELCERIIVRMAGGDSLRSICRDDSFPAMSTVLLWVVDGKHLEFSEQYTRAREAQGYFYADNILETALMAASGEIDPQSAKVIIDAYKWTAERNAPKAYGIRQSKIEHTGANGGPIEHKVEVSAADKFAEILNGLKD